MDDIDSGPARHVTIKDVARRAGVSATTVSNVINGRHGAMRAETRRRVEAEIRALNYRPDVVARALRNTKRYAIGLLVVDQSPTFLANPYVTLIAAGLSNFLSEQGYTLVVQRMAPHDYESAPMLRYIGTDGMCAILSGGQQLRREFLQVLTGLSQPVVVFEESLRLSGAHTCVVREDDYGGARSVIEHLLGRGARSFLILAPSMEWPGMMERRRGFDETIREHGATGQTLVCKGADFASASEALEGYLRAHGPPDAVVAGNDLMGVAAQKVLQAHGYDVPGHVRVTGFNGQEICRYVDPVLTSVHVPGYELGVTAGTEMLRKLEDGRYSASEIVLPVHLQAGGST